MKWWQWLTSIPKETNPSLDSSGEYSAENQDETNVWFLAGTFGGLVERRCTIPSGKAILMPVINYECSFADEPLINTDIELERKCKHEIDDIKNISVRIDELDFEDISYYRICSSLFVVNLKNDNILGVAAGFTKMISDGYWIFLKPLEVGNHQINSFGSCRSGKIRIGTTYRLHIR